MRNPILAAGPALALALLAGCDGKDPARPPAPDTTAPALRLDSPAAGEVVGPDSAVVVGFASDSVGVTRLTYTLGGGAEQPVQTTPAAGGVAFRLVLKPLPAGELRLVLYAYDAAENRGTASLSLAAATARVRLTAPDPEVPLRAFAAFLHGVVASPSPVAKLTYTVDGGDERPLCTAPGSCLALAAGEERFAWEIDGLRGGTADVTVYTYDAAGTKTGRGDVRLRVDVPFRRYAVRYLGTLGGSDSQGADLNEKGQVVGWSLDAARATRAFFWDGTRMTAVGGELGSESRAVAINEGGDFAGTYTRGECRHSFFSRAGAEGPTAYVGVCGDRAVDLDDAGQVLVGRFESAPGKGGVWRAGTYTPLLTYPYYDLGTIPLFINNPGRVLGYHASAAFGTSPRPQAAWLGTTTYPEPVFPGGVTPRALSDRGHVAFSCSEPGLLECDGLVSRGGAPDAIPQVGRRHSGVPSAMNERTQVAGTYAWRLLPSGETVRRPFVWENGVAYAVLPADAAWEIDAVSAISDAGTILAHGRNPGTGAAGAVLLTPVP